MNTLFMVLILFFSGTIAISHDNPCSRFSGVGSQCQLLVDPQVLEHAGLSDAEIVSVVIAPGPKVYILKEDTLSAITLGSGNRVSIRAKVEANYSFISTKHFIRLSKLRGWK